MTKLDQYCKFKTEFKFEPYLVNIVNDKLRKCLTHNSDYPLIKYELKLVNIVMNHEKIDYVSFVIKILLNRSITFYFAVLCIAL